MALEFTEKAKNALLQAQKAAKQFHAGYVGTEHLLLGLIRERTGVAAMVLKENHVDETRLEDLIQEAIVPQGSLLLRDHKEYSVKAAKVLEESGRYEVRAPIRGIIACGEFLGISSEENMTEYIVKGNVN